MMLHLIVFSLQLSLCLFSTVPFASLTFEHCCGSLSTFSLAYISSCSSLTNPRFSLSFTSSPLDFVESPTSQLEQFQFILQKCVPVPVVNDAHSCFNQSHQSFCFLHCKSSQMLFSSITNEYIYISSVSTSRVNCWLDGNTRNKFQKIFLVDWWFFLLYFWKAVFLQRSVIFHVISVLTYI